MRKLIKVCLKISKPHAAVPKLALCELKKCLGWVTMVQLDLHGRLSPASVKLFVLFFVGFSWVFLNQEEGRGRSAVVKVVLPTLHKVVNCWQAMGV